MKTIKTLTLLLVAFSIFACNKDEEPTVLTLMVSPTQVNGQSFESFTQEVQIQSNTKWTVAGQNKWCTTSTNSGNGDGKFTISVTENKTPDERIVKLIVQTSNKLKYVTVVQPGNPALATLAVSKTEITGQSPNAFNSDVDITAGGLWQISDMAPWVTVSSNSGTGNTTVTISIKGNNTLSERKDTLKVTTSKDQKEIIITQPGQTIDVSGPITINQSGKFLDLTAAASYMIVPDNAVFDVPKDGSFSIAMKVKVDHATSDGALVNKRSSGEGFQVMVRSTTASHPGVILFNAKSSGGNAGSYWGDDAITDGKWHSVVAVYDNGTKNLSYLYIDGVLQGDNWPNNNVHPGGNGMSNDEPLLFGLADINGGKKFYGYLDDVRFYSKALSKEEVYADAANMTNVNISGLVAGWDFSSESNNQVPDVVNSAIKGELKGGAKVSQ